MALPRKDTALLSEEEQKELNRLIQTFKRADSDLSNTQQQLNLLDQWIVTLQTRINPHCAISHQNEAWLLLQYLFGQGNAFNELINCLSRLTNQKSVIAQQESIEKAADLYYDSLTGDFKPRLLASTQQLLDLFHLTETLNKENVHTIKIQLLQLELNDHVKGLRSINPLAIKLKMITELDALLTLFSQYLFQINTKMEPPIILLLKYLLTEKEKQEHLLNNLAKLAQVKNAEKQQALLSPYYDMRENEPNPNSVFHLSSPERKELISMTREDTSLTSNPTIEQLYRSQLATSIEILESTNNLVQIKEELKTCFSIVRTIEARTFSTPLTEAGDPHELFLKYLALEDKKIIIKPLFTISRIADFLNTKSTQAIQEKLLELKKFQDAPLNIDLNQLASQHTTLTNLQTSSLINLIKSFVAENNGFILPHITRLIKLIHMAKTAENFESLKDDYLAIIEMLVFIKNLISYAKLQNVFIKPSLEKDLQLINDKFGSLVEVYDELFKKAKEPCTDQKKFNRKLDKLQEKQKKLAVLRNGMIIGLIENDIIFSIFDNLLSLISRTELQYHLETVTTEKLKSMIIESQLINLIQPFFRTWQEKHKTTIAVLKSIIPLFKMVNSYLPSILIKSDTFTDPTPKMSASALKVIANSSCLSNQNSQSLKVENYIDDIEKMFALNTNIEKRLKRLNLVKSRIRKNPHTASIKPEEMKVTLHSLPLLLFKPGTTDTITEEPVHTRTIHSSLDLDGYQARREDYGNGREKKHMRSYANIFNVTNEERTSEISSESSGTQANVRVTTPKQ